MENILHNESHNWDRVFVTDAFNFRCVSLSVCITLYSHQIKYTYISERTTSIPLIYLYNQFSKSLK